MNTLCPHCGKPTSAPKDQPCTRCGLYTEEEKVNCRDCKGNGFLEGSLDTSSSSPIGVCPQCPSCKGTGKIIKNKHVRDRDYWVEQQKQATSPPPSLSEKPQMATYHCPRCSKETPVFLKIVPVSSRPIIAGHLLNNPNLPMIGVPLGSSTTSALCCKVCGEEVHRILSAEESKVRKDNDDAMVGLTWFFVVIAIVIGIMIALS